MEFIVPEWITPSWKSVTQQKDLGTVGLRQSNINSWSETVVEMWSLEKEPRAGIENCLCVLTWQKSLDNGQRNRRHPLWQVLEAALFVH